MKMLEPAFRKKIAAFFNKNSFDKKISAARARIVRLRKDRPRAFWCSAAGIAAFLILAGTMLFSHGAPKISIEVYFPGITQVRSAADLTVLEDEGSAKVVLPEPDRSRKADAPPQIHVSFRDHYGYPVDAAAPEFIGKDISAHVKTSPAIKGSWRFDGARAILFTPEYDWPAGEEFRVKFDSKLFDEDIDSTSFELKTPKFGGELKLFASYSNPAKPRTIIAVAQVDFTHELESDGFEDRVSLKLKGKDVGFSVKFDNLKRQAFIYSKPIYITDDAQTLKLAVDGARTVQGGRAADAVKGVLSIAAAGDFFKLASSTASIVRNERDVQEQVLMLEFTDAAIDPARNVSLYLLPLYRTENERSGKIAHSWEVGEVGGEDLADTFLNPLALRSIPMDGGRGRYEYGLVFSADIERGRHLYLKIDPGIKSESGFEIKSGYETILRVPEPEKTVKIVGGGSILPLGGSRELSFVAQGGLKEIKVEVARVNSGEINHLVTQTYSTMKDADFRNYSFSESNISTVFRKDIKLSQADTSYASINLGDYMNYSTKGIFIVDVYPKDSYKKSSSGDRRLVMLSDIGIVRKRNEDGSSSVFAVSLSTGRPAAGADVSVLGKNGSSIHRVQTGSGGRAELPNFPGADYRAEREPVAITVSSGGDLSFIPYEAYDNLVDYSRYDIDGLYWDQRQTLEAYMFSDRGIYRPGEDALIAGVAKDRDYKSLAGMPFILKITDSKGAAVSEKRFTLDGAAAFDHSFRIGSSSPTGTYLAELYALGSGERARIESYIGRAEFKVEEFVPDNLRIKVALDGLRADGWNSLDELKAKVSLKNLFGTPAADRKVAARMLLSPARFSFKGFEDYVFPDNFIEGTGMARGAASKTIHEALADAETDKDGEAVVVLATQKPVSGTYSMSLEIEGFEGGGGRSVSATAVAKISDAKYLIGYKPDGGLEYIARNARRSLRLVALAPDLSNTGVPNLSMRVIEKKTLTSLVKNYNGQYKYQSVARNRVVSRADLSVPEAGRSIALDTSRAGEFHLEILDESGKLVAHAGYFVSGGENASVKEDANAELKIRMDKPSYESGDAVTLNISAPYAGTGLITLERDRVYSHSWFKSDAASSVQSIRIPEGFEGTGYINVSFVRDINSRAVFASPHVFAVVPVKVENPARRIRIDLSAPKVVRDRVLNIGYSIPRPASLMVFAVNEGVLQVAKYATPNPAVHFFRKHALQVRTYQILDRLLPEYRILREVAKVGGSSEYAMEALGRAKAMMNPFARKADKPVAFYSGIIKDAGAGSVKFDIPEGFNGEIRVFAVASDGRSFGSAEVAAIAKSPVAIVPSAPLMAAPGDEFEVSATIANMSEGSGPEAEFAVSVSTLGGIQADFAPTVLTIPENEERKVAFKARALDRLGEASITIAASSDGARGSSTSSLSIRPASMFTTNIKAGFGSGSFEIKDFKNDMFAELRSRKLYISTAPFVLARPIFQYLLKYDFGCSEQTASKTMPYVLFAGNKFLGIEREDAAGKVAAAIATLKNRQNADGSFSPWDGQWRAAAADRHAWLSAYVTHFLILAKENGFSVPREMLSNALAYLRTYAGYGMENAADIEAKAFAIYVATLGSHVTTNYIGMFEEFADAKAEGWERTIAGSYIAASYKLLKQDARAQSLISKFDSETFSDIARHAYLAREHFGHGADIAAAAVREYANRGAYGSFDAASAILALAPSSEKILGDLDVTAGKDAIERSEDAGGVAAFDIPDSALRLGVSSGGGEVFWALVEQGFPLRDEGKPNGLNVYREYRNRDGDTISSASVGDEVEVVIYAKTAGKVESVPDVAIVDMLPAGFSAIADSVEKDGADFVDVREDRVLVFRPVGREYSKTSYRAKATAKGKFAVPAIKAQAMYDTEIRGHGSGGTFKVE